MNSSVDTPRKSDIGKTELNTACSPVSSRSSGSMFICRNRSYEFFCTSMRFGIWIAVRIFEKFVLSREVVVLVSAILIKSSLNLARGRAVPTHKHKEADPRTDYSPQVSTRILLLLLNLDCCASFSELLLDTFCFVFVYAFFDRFRCTFYEIFGFLQSKACYFADGFNNADLVPPYRSKNNAEFGLLLGRSCGCGATAAASGWSCCNGGCSCAYTKRFFNSLDQLRS